MPDAATSPDPTSDIPAYLFSRDLSATPPQPGAPQRFDPSKIIAASQEREKQLETKGEELLKQQQAVGEREKADIDRLAGLRERAFKPIAAPTDPKLEKMPQPPSEKFQDPMKAFSSPGVFLAALGSLFTRHPMTAAFQAGAAALEGFQKGDTAAMESQRERWQEAVKVAAENNRNELERYNAAWKKTDHNMTERAAKLNEIALSQKDAIMKAAIDSGNIDQAYKLLQDRGKAQEHLDEVLIREQDRREMRDLALGRFNMQTQKFEAQAGTQLGEADVRRIAESYIAGDHSVMKDIPKGIYGSAGTRAVNAMITKIMDEKGLSPRDIQANAAELKALNKEEATVAGRAGNIALAVNEAKAAIPIALASSRAAPRDGFAFWDAIENKWRVQSGSPEYAQFVANLNSLINIYGRAISGSAKGTVSDLEHAREMLNPNQPTQAFEGAIRGMQQELEIAYNSPKQTVDELRARWTRQEPSPVTSGGGAGSGTSPPADPLGIR